MKLWSSFSFFVSRSSLTSPVLSSISTSIAALHFHSISKELISDQKTLNHVTYIKDFLSLIKIFANNNRDIKVLSAIDSMLTKTHILDSSTSVLVIEGLCHLKKLGRAKDVLSNLKKKGKLSEHFIYSLVIQCLVVEGKIKDVDSVWNEICGFKSCIGIDDFVIYICKFGEVSEIEWVYKRVLMGHGVLKRQSYVALIGSLCRKNACLLAKDVLRDMMEMGLEPDDLTYLGLFQCFCKNGNLSEADLILRNLVRRNYSIDVCVYGSFISGLCKFGKLREADKLFRRLIEKDSLANAVFPLKRGRRAIFQLNCKGVVPEIMAYETYFRSLCSVGRVEDAEKLLKKMLRKTTVPEICVYRSFIKALFRIGRVDDAVNFFNMERKKRLVCVGEISVPVVLGFCEMGRLDDAYSLLNEILDGEFVPTANVFNCIIDSYCKAGRLDEAMSVFERMGSGSCSRPDVATYTIIVSALCVCGNVQKALCVFHEMLNNNVVVNGTLYRVIIRGLCESGRLEEAYKYSNEMIEKGHLVSYFGWRPLFDSMFVGDDFLLRF
ncbi:uncharacterized protein LOC143850765 [Tasmannia lanceolata]|uniref:uncharacterized protein LOC143850765 n=1 Tax=Tasmannia lanceolata TaxID=3420 RepID=UPI0040643FED